MTISRLKASAVLLLLLTFISQPLAAAFLSCAQQKPTVFAMDHSHHQSHASETRSQKSHHCCQNAETCSMTYCYSAALFLFPDAYTLGTQPASLFILAYPETDPNHSSESRFRPPALTITG